MPLKKVMVVALLIMHSSLSTAAIAHRTAIIHEVQTESSTRVGYESIMYVLQSASWQATNNCPATYAYFNANENPHFVATVLLARATETPLKVVVDDSLARISGFCQIINMSL